MKKLIIAIAFFGLIPGLLPAEVLHHEDDLKNLVVAVSCDLKQDHHTGAGYIIGAKLSNLYIATSNALVRGQGAARLSKAENLEVQINNYSDKIFPAQLLSSQNEQLDLAVLKVNITNYPDLMDGLRMDLLGDSEQLQRGDSVYVMGKPNERGVSLKLSPFLFLTNYLGKITFQIDKSTNNYYGGVLIDRSGRIVGQIGLDDGTDGIAYAMNNIVDWLKNEGFPVDLKYGSTGSGMVNETPLSNNNKRINSGTTPTTPPRTMSYAGKVKFRSEPATLNGNQVKTMIAERGFVCQSASWSKKWANPTGPGFTNDYELQYNGEVVVDKNCGLMWQQSGSIKSITYKNALEYIDQLNAENFAGHSDWRLPTLEEALALLEPSMSSLENNLLYVDPIFDSTQRSIFTADISEEETTAWTVTFTSGYCYYFNVLNHVRAVRS